MAPVGTAALTAATIAVSVLAQGPPSGTISPLAIPASQCGFNASASVVCINKYAAVMPYHFNRSVSSNNDITSFGDTVVGNDTSFSQVSDADFLIFDQQAALQYLGPNPSYEYVFPVSKAVHEAPVYAAAQNLLFLSQLAPPPGYLPQLVINLNNNPPTISEFLSDPPVYAPNGGTFLNGKVIWGASGGNDSIGGTEQRVSLRTLDPATNKTSVLLNNYLGYYFNTIDDLAAHPATGQIFFTDPFYSSFNSLSDTPPQLPSASYRFNPSTGATSLIDSTLIQPNGIAFSPTFTTLYITDSGAVSAQQGGSVYHNSTVFDPEGQRAIYAWDVSADGTSVSNKRAFYLAPDWVPDGLKVSAEGLVLTGNGKGIDVISPQGALVARVQTNYTVQNFAWTGAELTTLWLMGQGGVSKVEWNVRGQRLT